MSDYDLTKNSSHPIGTTSDPYQRGDREREKFGAGNQAGQQASESWADYQRRVHGKY